MKDSKDTDDPTGMGEATDGQLFALMTRKDDVAKEAWAVFYQRYIGDLRRLVCRVRGLPQASIDEMVQDTMVQAYHAAHTFCADDSLNDERARRRTLAWLGRMARNLYWSMLRQQRGVTVGGLPEQENGDGSRLSTKGRPLSAGELYREIQSSEDRVAGEPSVDERTLRRWLLREALDTLSERERDIIIQTYEHHERGQKQQRLPEKVVTRLCETHGISPTYLRQIRKRAQEKIQQYVTARMPAES